MIHSSAICLFVSLCFLLGSSETSPVDQKWRIPPVFHMDNYDDCMTLGEKALYCTFSYTFSPSPENQIWKKLQQLSSETYNYQHHRLRQGICLPRYCPSVTVNQTDQLLQNDVERCCHDKYAYTGMRGEVSELKCERVKAKLPLDRFDILIGFLLSLLVGFVLIASILDAFTVNSGTDSMLMVFSLKRNWNKLRTIKQSPDIERLRGIQGIRFMNTVLVILTHTMMLTFMLPISNTRITETLSERVTTVFITSGPLCVSTFFMISSWLLLHGLLDNYKDKTQISLKELVIILIHRYIRLVPTLALVVTFVSSWLRHLGEGPRWNHYVGREYQQCRKNGWTNLLFINNFVDPGNMCLQTTWYMALEFQYFIICLIIIVITKKYPRAFWWILGMLLTASTISTFMDNYKNGFPAILLPKAESLYDLNHTLKNDQFLVQYISFIGNLAGPIIGLGIGHIYHKNKEKMLFNKKIHNILWWIVSHMFTYGVILIPGALALKYGDDHSRFWSSLHIALSRPLFAFGIGFGLLGLTHGAGGFLKSLFEWPPLYVLGRLTYTAYLVHIPLLLLKIGTIRSPVYLNEFNLFFDFLGSVAITYLAATVVTLFFEMPMAELQKRLFSKTFQHKTESTKKDE